MSAPEFGFWFRRYAPFATFGVPSFKGDGRAGPSTSMQATSRTYGCVRFNQFEILNQFAGSSGTEDANLVLTFLDRKAMANVSVSAVRSNLAGPGLLSFKASTAGANPLIPKSPDIDTRVDVRVDWGMPNWLRISGTISGDDFPNLEVFLRCYGSGKSALLVDGRTQRGRRTGPFSLYGDGGELAKFQTAIALNDSGTFLADGHCSPIDI